MAALIRDDVLEDFVVAAQALQADPWRALARAGVDAPAVLRGETFVPYARFVQVVNEMAAATGSIDFGLRMSAVPDDAFEGPLIPLPCHAETLRHAVELAQRYAYVVCPLLQPRLAAVPGRPGLVDVVLTLDDGAAHDLRQVTEYFLASTLRIVRTARGALGPQFELHLPHAPLMSAARYAEHLDCSVRFEAPLAAVRLPEAELDVPLPRRSALRTEMAVSYIETRCPAPGEEWTARVRRLLREGMQFGRVAQAEIAAALAMHEKTLQRRLASEGRQFSALLDEVRRDAFVELLRQPTALNLARVAQALGYSEQAVLSRSCQRWFGCTPSALLARLTGTAAPAPAPAPAVGPGAG